MYGVYSLGGLRASVDRHVRVRRRGVLDRGGSRTLAGRGRSRVLGDVPAGARRRAVGVVDPRPDARPAALYGPPLAPRHAGASPSRRVWLAFPLLVVWANIHGSVALGALLVMLLGAYELVRSRGATWRRSLAPDRARPARRARDPVRPGRRPRATTTSCSSIRRSPDASPSGAGRSRRVQHDVLLRARGDRGRCSYGSGEDG